VPNSQFVSERVTNWSRPDKLTAYTLSFHVSHTSDPELVRQVLLAAAVGHRDVLPEPMAEVEFVEVGLGALRFQLQVWSTEQSEDRGHVKERTELRGVAATCRSRRDDCRCKEQSCSPCSSCRHRSNGLRASDERTSLCEPCAGNELQVG
jgi:Mechanosensitive ion channel MscS, C-terminal